MARDLSDCSSSEDEEMIVAIMFELALAPKVALGSHLNLDDLSPLECEQLFRSAIKNTCTELRTRFKNTVGLRKKIFNDCSKR